MTSKKLGDMDIINENDKLQLSKLQILCQVSQIEITIIIKVSMWQPKISPTT